MNKDLKEKFGFTLGATHVSISHNTRRVAFTLAEVLITLGIIGIVSAMTIPTLVKKYQEITYNTSAEVFSQKLTEALKIMNIQSTLVGYTTTEDFVMELGKHLKIVNMCTNDKLLNCFADTVYYGGGTATPKKVDMSVIKISKNFGQPDWKTNIVGVQFANGTNALIAYNPTKSCTQNPVSNLVTGEDCLAILYDTSGDKLPNTSGKDLRANSNVTILNGCAFEIGKTCYMTVPFVPEPVTKAECEQMIKDNYGIKNCRFDDDYWAGAVKACGGVNKLPTAEQLAELANYIYNTNNIGAKVEVADLKLDENKAKALGFKLNSAGEFFVWANKEYSNTYSYIQYFYPNSTKWDEPPRTGSTYQTICLE